MAPAVVFLLASVDIASAKTFTGCYAYVYCEVQNRLLGHPLPLPFVLPKPFKVVDDLASSAASHLELCAAILALNKHGDGHRAHSLILNAHNQRYRYNMKSICPSSTTYGGAYTASLSQLVFSIISQVASDSLAIFGKEPAYTSELVVCPSKQTEDFALLVKRHALSSSAAAWGLRDVKSVFK